MKRAALAILLAAGIAMAIGCQAWLMRPFLVKPAPHRATNDFRAR